MLQSIIINILKGHYPKSGEIVNVPPKRLPHFKVGRELREMVNRIKEGRVE